MVNDQKLSAVLSEFARTMVTDFPIQGILDHLVERIVEILPVTAAGVTLITAGEAPRYVAASDESALRFEKLQTEIGEGPCLLAFESGEAVSVPDLRVDAQFPRFSPAAVAAGLVAVFTFPLRHGALQLGALDLYRNAPGVLDPEDLRAAQPLADVAAASLLNAQARDAARVTSDRFHHSALHDPLTGLPNRLLLQQRLEHAALRAQRSRTNAAVLFADLDRFKRVNDTHGHQVGDELLLQVARRLAELVRPGDTLARVSGDEFVFLCEDLHDPGDVEILARRIDSAFVAPFKLSKLELSITASVGMAFAGPGDSISDQLVVKADIAMYQAKRKGGGTHQILDLREAVQTENRITLERELRAALAQDALEVAYQPIVRSGDLAMVGVEALLRWTHPERGAISPLTMIQLAEESGLINEIGAWVLDRGCRDRAHWLRTHPDRAMELSVNVSVRQIMSLDFAGAVFRTLTETGMDPTSLVLEMTENIFIEDSERALLVLAELRELGVRLALDDFGTGFSSLSYLRRLPVHIVKIDQSFIADIDHAATSRNVAAAIAKLAHGLGFTVTAEGVETRSQHEKVGDMGCEFAQGYFYSRPMSADAVAAYLGQSRGAPLRLPSLASRGGS